MTKFSSKTWVGSLRVSTVFGAIDYLHKTPHSGVDITTSGPCLAPFDGVVTRDLSQGISGGLGNYFQMVSNDGRFVFTVGHGNKNSDTGLRRGARISAGETILADMGRPSTGYSTGPHYHEQLTDRGRLVNLLNYLGKTWGASSAPVVEVGGWDGVSTLYKGNYADDGLVYTIHVGETIWAVAQSKGVTLDQVRAWTSALASSKYAGAQLAKSGAGASWWNGGDKYYAGATFAVADVVAKLAAEDKAVAEAKRATADQAVEAAAEAANAVLVANLGKPTETVAVAAQAVETAGEADREIAAADAELTAAIERAKALIPDIEGNLDRSLSGGPDANQAAVLAGLLAGRPSLRKRVYYAYATGALLVSIGPDIVVAGVLSDAATPGFVTWVALASSILLKVGTAFGFVAASNTAKGK